MRRRAPKPKADGTYRRFQTEAELQKAIENFARELRFRVFHDELARGYYKGFPDLMICGHGLAMYVECKGPNGSTTPHQEAWIAELEAAGQLVILASTEDDTAGYERVTNILMEAATGRGELAAEYQAARYPCASEQNQGTERRNGETRTES